MDWWNFPGGPEVKTSSSAGGADSVPGQGTPTCLEAKNPKHKTETVL